MKRVLKYVLGFVLLAVVAGIGLVLATAWQVHSRAARVDAGMERWMDEGRDTKEIAELVSRVPKLMDAGRAMDALALMDEAIAKLETPAPETAAAKTGDDSFGAAQEVTVEGYDGNIMEPFISPDGKYLFFNNENNPGAETDIYFATRTGPTAFHFEGALAAANGQGLDAVPSIDRDGNFYFTSTRAYDKTLDSIYTGRFDGKTLADVHVVAGITPDVAGDINMDASISPDGEALYISRATFEGGVPVPQKSDIIIAHRTASGFEIDPHSREMMVNVNTAQLEYAPAISADGLTLYFTRAEGMYGLRIMSAHRDNVDAPFDAPQDVTAARGFVEAPSVSADGTELFFHKKRDDKFRLFRAARKG